MLKFIKQSICLLFAILVLLVGFDFTETGMRYFLLNSYSHGFTYFILGIIMVVGSILWIIELLEKYE